MREDLISDGLIYVKSERPRRYDMTAIAGGDTSTALTELTDKQSSTIGTGNYKFPNDVENSSHFMKIRIVDRVFLSRNSPNETIKNLCTITLPMPSSLDASYSADYTPTDLTAILAGTAAVLATTAARKLASRRSQALETQRIRGSSVGEVLGAIGAGGIVKTLSVAAGYTYNPHKSLAFSGMQLRKHQISLALSAKSSLETATITDIIKALKTGMHPEYDDLLLKYPHEYLIEFNHPEHLFKTHRCVLEGLSVRYHSEGQAIYFRDTNAPVTVGIQMTFQETDVIYRGDVSRGL